ncbi:right-handed parallel beta-helix repeat-containing protein [Methanosarcina sp. Mfa9]|uniref:right-handed parallel beta-helix repeat-containing protein n=1 Tax=Methanosarcina sp. Mfa9 TaxID=3439063 RepID=UPI003F878530
MRLRPIFMLLIMTALAMDCASAVTISDIEVKPLAYSAHIYFDTDINTDCYVEYSTNSDMSDSFNTSWNNNSHSHDIFLWDNYKYFLDESTRYYYKIWAYNSSNCADYINSSIKTFETIEAVTEYTVPDEGSVQDGIFNISHDGGTLKLAANGHYEAEEYPFGNYILTQSYISPYFRTKNLNIVGQNATIDMRGHTYGFFGDFLDGYVYNFTIQDVNIHNASQYGIYIYNGIQLTIDDLDIYDCGSSGIYARYAQGSNIIITNCTIYECGNWGIDVNGDQDIVVAHNTIYNNSFYGGINYNYASNVEVYNNTIYDCNYEGPDLEGDIIQGRATNGAGTNVSIYNNNATNCGRGLRVANGATGVEIYNNVVSMCGYNTLDIYPNTIVDIHDNIFNNGATASIYPALTSVHHIHRNIFNNVTLKIDGDILKRWVSHNSTIYENVFDGKGLLVSYSEGIAIRNNIFKNGAYVQTSNNPDKPNNHLKLNNNVFYNSPHALIISEAYLSNSEVKNNIFMNISDWIIDAGNFNNVTVCYNCVWNCDENTLFKMSDFNRINQNPLLMDTANGDFHLYSDSPCIDAGDPNDDYSKEPEPNGGRIDIGCYGNTIEPSVKTIPYTISNTVVSILPSSSHINTGDVFTINISINPTLPITGAQFDIISNSSMVTINSIIEGNLLNQNGAETFFNNGTINNSAGTVTEVYGSILGASNVSSLGVMATITMTAGNSTGIAELNLSNVIVSDSDSKATPISISNANVLIDTAPVLNSIGPKSVSETNSLNFAVDASDADGDSLTYSATGLPEGANFDPASGVFTWTPARGQAGVYTTIFEVSDGYLSDSEDVSITVSPANNVPVIDSFEPANGASFNEKDKINILVNALDLDGQLLSYIIKINGVTCSTEPTYIWKTDYSSSGEHTVEVTVSDGVDQVTEQHTVYINDYHPEWDVNKDWKVDILDLANVSQKYGTTTTEPYPRWDVTQDGEVNIQDLSVVGYHFGETIE